MNSHRNYKVSCMLSSLAFTCNSKSLKFADRAVITYDYNW